MCAEANRTEVQRLPRQVPFQPFSLLMENGDRVRIEHPENIAFDPDTDAFAGSREFYVITGAVRLFSTFDAVTSIGLQDRGVVA